MLYWLKKLIGGKAGRGRLNDDGPTESYYRRVSPADAVHVEEAFRALAEVGVRLTPKAAADVRATARDQVRGSEGISFGGEPSKAIWALFALDARPGTFENAISLQDDAYDGAGPDDYRDVVSNIVALAAEEWRVTDVRATVPDWDDSAPVTVTLAVDPAVTPFELERDKHFDWSIIFRLNERLRADVAERFAICVGGTFVVFLKPEAIRRLNVLCDNAFLWEDDSINLI